MLERIRRFFIQLKPSNRDAQKLREAHAVLEEHGLTALWWIDDTAMDLDTLKDGQIDVYLAVKRLRNHGCIIVDSTGRLPGRLFKMFDTKDDIVRQRRASFRLVETTNDRDPN